VKAENTRQLDHNRKKAGTLKKFTGLRAALVVPAVVEIIARVWPLVQL